MRDFKRIDSVEAILKPIIAFVGGNTSGESSALQAAQLGDSISQAALRNRRCDGSPASNDAAPFRPTELLLGRYY